MRDYIEYMRKEKRKADNTLVAYERDLKAFDSFLNSRGVNGLEGCSDSDESIDLEWIDTEKCIDLIMKGEIQDSKTIIGILFARQAGEI